MPDRKEARVNRAPDARWFLETVRSLGISQNAADRSPPQGDATKENPKALNGIKAMPIDPASPFVPGNVVFQPLELQEELGSLLPALEDRKLSARFQNALRFWTEEITLAEEKLLRESVRPALF